MNRRTFLQRLGIGAVASVALPATAALASHKEGHNPGGGTEAPTGPTTMRLEFEWQGVDQFLDAGVGRNFIEFNKVARDMDPDGVLSRYGLTGIQISDSGLYQVNAGISFKNETTFTKSRWLAIHEAGTDVRQPLVFTIDQSEKDPRNDSGDAALAAGTTFVGPGAVEVWVLTSHENNGLEAVAPGRASFLEVARIG